MAKKIIAAHGFFLRKVTGKVPRSEMLCGRRSPLNSEGKPRRFAGMWIGPGGVQEDGETPKQTMWREELEEYRTISDPDSFELLGRVGYHYPENGDMVDWLVDLFRITEWSGMPEPGDGFDELRWFRLNSLPYAEMMADMPIIVPELKLEQPSNGKLFRAEFFYTDKTCRAIERHKIWFEDRDTTG